VGFYGIAAQDFVARAVHGAHASGANLAKNAVVVDGLADHGLGCCI
jgi:hypothetical protein